MVHPIIAGTVLLLASGVAVFSSQPDDPLEIALIEAEGEPKLRFSFTMAFEVPGKTAIVQRYDAAADKWTVLSGDPDDLKGDSRQKLRNVMKSETVPGGLLYADFRKHIKDITPLGKVEGDPGTALYAFLPPEAEGREVTPETEEAMRARIYVDIDSGILSRYEVRALQPISPLPGVKMREFAVTQEFDRIGETGPAVLRKLYSRAEGRRLLKKVDTEFTATFSDFMQVDG